MTICDGCSQPIPIGQEKKIIAKNKAIRTLCANCIAKIESAFKAETENPNIVLAIVLAFCAALISALIWYGAVVITNYKLGIVAIGIGFIVAQATIFGSGKKRGIALQVISVLATVLAMVFSEYLIVRYFAVQVLSTEGYSNIPLLLPLNTIIEMIGISLSSDPLTLLFWLIAAFEAFVIPMKRKLQYSKTPALRPQ